MFGDLEGVDGLRVDVEFFREFEAEAGGVKNGAGADDVFGGEAGVFPGEVGHDVHGVSDDEEDAAEAVSHNFFNHGAEDAGVFLEQVKASLSRFLVGAGGDDDDVAAAAVGVRAGFDFHVGGGDGESVAEIHGFAFGVVCINVNQDEFVDGGALVNEGKSN